MNISKHKNDMLEKTIKGMNNGKLKSKANELKRKTEDDFIKEVAEVKCSDVILLDKLEIVEKENKMQ